MNKDVYFLCPTCNGITEGNGNGDITDIITCKKCGNKFKSRMVGNLSISLEEKDKKWLYIEYENANVFV